MQAIWLDGEPFALTQQLARKEATDYRFVSEAGVDKARMILFDAMKQRDARKSSILDMDQVFSSDDCYSVVYGPEMLVYEGLYRGQKATVVEDYAYYANPNGHHPTKKTDADMWTKVKVRLEDGSEHVIETQDFRIPIPVIS